MRKITVIDILKKCLSRGGKCHLTGLSRNFLNQIDKPLAKLCRKEEENQIKS